MSTPGANSSVKNEVATPLGRTPWRGCGSSGTDLLRDPGGILKYQAKDRVCTPSPEEAHGNMRNGEKDETKQWRDEVREYTTGTQDTADQAKISSGDGDKIDIPCMVPEAPTALYQNLRLSSFSGDTDRKGDVDFETWMYEVECLQEDQSCNRSLILRMVKRSLRGSAAKLVMLMPKDVTLNDIVQKLDGVYGEIESGALFLSRFYANKQREIESIADYGVRL